MGTTDSWYGGYLPRAPPRRELVGRVGNGPWIHVGSGPTTLRGIGELLFAANDDLFPDNTGNFVVNVPCWPGWGWATTTICTGPAGRRREERQDRTMTSYAAPF